MSQGVRPGQVFTFTDSRGHQRCAACDVIQRSKGRGPGFRFRFHRGSDCGLISGCPALSQMGGAAPPMGITLGQTATIPQLR
jgi:hypothetical protein